MIGKNQYKWLYLAGLFILLSIIFLIIPVKRREKEPFSTSDKRYEKPIVSKIIDGDTFELSDGTRVRMIGVDTPEIDRPFYRQAVALAESLLMGKQIEYETDAEERDRYGRHLWYVFADSIFVNDRIISRGMGRVYLFQSNIKYADLFIRSQKKAREAKSGIWSLPLPPPEDFYIALQGSFRFHRPLCMSIKGADTEKVTRYRSRDSLLDLGISPCRNCRP